MASAFDPSHLVLGPDFSAKDAAHQVREHGLVVIRQLLDPRKVEALGSLVLEAFAQLDARRNTLSQPDLHMLDRMEMPVPDRDASFRTRVENYSLLDSDRLVETIEGIGGPFVWHFPPQIRRQSPSAEHAFLPYHQDASYLKHYNGFAVCWVPLTPCGEDAPGLEFAVGHMDKLLSHEASGVWEEGLADSEKSFLESLPTFAPVLHPGDVVLFDDKTLHRTFVPDQVSKVRLSIDFRAPWIPGIKDEPRKTRKFVDPRTRQYVEQKL